MFNGLIDLKDVVTLLALLVQWRIFSIRWQMATTNSNTKTASMMAKKRSLILPELVERNIRWIRGHKVMLDIELAKLYGVETRALVQAVKRNLARFPNDFMFQLTATEYKACLKSQFVISKGRGGRRTRPYAFTEQGVAMLSSVLNSEQAVQVNIEIMRAFVRLRQMLATHAGLARKLGALEKKYDSQFRVVFDAIRALMEPPPDPPRKRIGYATEAQGLIGKHRRRGR